MELLEVGKEVIFKQVGFEILVKVSKVSKTLITLENGTRFRRKDLTEVGTHGFSIVIPTSAELEHQMMVEAVKSIAIDIKNIDFLTKSPASILRVAEWFEIEGDAVEYLKSLREAKGVGCE